MILGVGWATVDERVRVHPDKASVVRVVINQRRNGCLRGDRALSKVGSFDDSMDESRR